MGNQNLNIQYPNEPKEKITKSDFDYLTIIGKGGFGKVWKVYCKHNKKQYALKEMSKVKLIDSNSVKSVIYERSLLSRMNHPFIVNMHYSFQDAENLYIIMDLLTGGDIRYHINKKKKFSEQQTKFFIACVVLGLEYIHSNKIIHRDIKPENLIIDSKGYVKITDFGIAKVCDKEKPKEGSGTPGYMAPEVMCGILHSFVVDYFALGIMGYEFMNGVRPYIGKDRREIKEKMLYKQAYIKKSQLPNDWSIEGADFINRLLQRNPNFRLGKGGVIQIKEHAWFKYYPWRDLYLGQVKSPYIPKDGDNYDFKYCNKIEKVSICTRERYIAISNNQNFKIVFNDFSFYNRELEEFHNDNENYTTQFTNPHDIYSMEIEGEKNEIDATICNRNILSNKSTADDDIYTEVKKKPNMTLFNLYNKRKFLSSKTRSQSLNNSKGSLRNDLTLNSSYASRKKIQ